MAKPSTSIRSTISRSATRTKASPVIVAIQREPSRNAQTPSGRFPGPDADSRSNQVRGSVSSPVDQSVNAVIRAAKVSATSNVAPSSTTARPFGNVRPAAAIVA